jgi:Zn-dependent protease
MMLGIGTRFRVLTVRGIPLYVSASFLVLAVGLVLLNASFMTERAGTDQVTALTTAAVDLGLLFAVVLIHEAAHAVVARAFDVPVSGITLTFWGGATEAPSDAKGPLAEFLIAFAGPFSTLLIAGAAYLAAGQVDPYARPHDILDWLFRINLFLAFLNLIPGYPLDGGRMLEAAAWGITKRRSTSLRITGWVGTAVGLGFIALAIVRLGESGVGGAIWLGFIGFVIFTVGRSMPQRIAHREELARGTVREAMRPAGSAIDADTTLSEALDTSLLPYPDRAFPVVDGGKVVGVVSMGSARRIGSRDPLRPVRDAMRPLNQVAVLDPDTRLDDAWEWLAGRDGLVLHEGVLVGMLGPEDIGAWAEPTASVLRAPPPRPDV